MIHIVALFAISSLLLVWIAFEITIIKRFLSKGSHVTAVVSETQQYTTGDSLMELTITDIDPTKRFHMGHMSGGFRKLKRGDTLKVIYHPKVKFVVADSLAGVCARAAIATGLFLGSVVVLFSLIIPFIFR